MTHCVHYAQLCARYLFSTTATHLHTNLVFTDVCVTNTLRNLPCQDLGDCEVVRFSHVESFVALGVIRFDETIISDDDYKICDVVV